MLISIGTELLDGNKNKYKLDEVISRGGFGVVYKAHRVSDGKVFAVKTLLNDFEDPNSVLSFRKELQETLIIESDNVIKYYYVNDGEKQPNFPPYIIMEYADGGTLQELIDKRRASGELFTNEEILEYFRQLSEGMKAINAHLIHRDIKPINILFSNNSLKISDFGLSKVATESTRTLTFKGGGTYPYMAPETWKHDTNTIQLDMYSMGIVFYEIATLMYPYVFQGQPMEHDYMKAHMMQSPMDPSEYNDKLQPEIIAIILKMLEKPADKRFNSWDEILGHLKSPKQNTTQMDMLVTNAIKKRNATDLAERQKENARLKQIQEKQDYIELIESQFVMAVVNPIKKFAKQFNEQNPRDEMLRIYRRGKDINERFSFEISLGSKSITMECEIIFKENFKKEVKNIWGDYVEVEYIPQAQKRNILLWCFVNAENNSGFDLLLLENDKSDYGEMFMLKNQCSGFCSYDEWRPGVFGFDLYELPKEIELINCTHIYSSNISTLSDDDLIEFITNNLL